MQDDKLTPAELQELQELEELEKLEAMEARGELDPQPKQPEQMSELQSAALGAAQGVTFGFADEILAATETGQEVITDAVSSFMKNQANQDDNPSASISEQYKKHKDSIDKMFNEAKKTNPASYLTGDISGSLASSFLTLGGGAAFKAGSLTKSALELSKHAGVGFAQGVGRSEDDTIAGVAKEGLEGAAFGIAGEAVGPVVGAGVRKTKELTKRVQAGSLIKFLGDKYSSVEQNLSRVGKPVIEWAERLLDYGDGQGGKLVKVLKSRKDLLDDFKAARSNAGEEMGEILKRVDTEFDVNIDTTSIKQELIDQVVLPYRNAILPEEKAVAKQLDDWLDSTFENISKRSSTVDAKTGLVIPNKEYTPKNLTVADLQSMRSKMYKNSQRLTRSEDPITKNVAQAKINMAGIIGDEIDSLMSTLGTKENPLINQYKQARTKYGDISEAITSLDNSLNEQGQGFIHKLVNDKMFAFTSLAGAFGSKVGLPHSDMALAAAGLMAITKSNKVNGAIAKTAGNMANMLKADPDKFSGVAAKFVASTSLASSDFMESFGKLAAEASLLDSPLARDPQEVLRRSDTVLTAVEELNPEVAPALRAAISKRDMDSIGSIMSQVAAGLPKGYVQEGMGWGGKAYTQADLAGVKSYLQSIKNSRKRMLMTTEFNKTNMIPQEMYAPVQQEPMNQFIYRKAKDKIRNPEY